ncbi:alpha/beta fold hydrolase [Brevibacterium yomogidense]|uniref:alpha/beta fold hydrolase n=1 Tax=Brevibacterium yomogidense TaxID=946573 RepID=UPI000B35E448|nr:alpha/beta hydrolase [Brevibacterium yomogidense]
MQFPPSQRLVAGTDFPWPLSADPSPDSSAQAAAVRAAAPTAAAPTAAAPPAVWLYPARSPAEPSSTRRRPIVLIHGFRGDHHGLALIAHELRDRDVWVPDLPGFGSAPPPERGLDLAAFTAHIRALCGACEAASGRRPILIGHSFGSALAAHAYAQRPDISSGLGLLSPIVQPALEGSARVLTQLTRLYYAAGAALPERLGSALLAHPLIVRGMSEVMATSSDRMTRRFIHDQHARHFSDYADRRSLAEAYQVSIEHTVAEVADELAHASRPLLVVAGDDDLIAPIEAAAGFVADLRDQHVPVDAQTLTGVGHLLHYERPAAVADAIERFARTVDGA